MPAEVTLDIATKIVAPEQKIWAVFPGLARRFFEDFRTDSVVFLDTPRIALTSRALADDRLLRQHVAMSLAWRQYILGKSDKVPSDRPDTYDYPTDASFNAAVGNVRNLFVRMKPGDLVVVGRYDIYEPILIGEVQKEFDRRDVITLPRYGDAEIPTRRVEWISRDWQRRFLSKDLSLRLSNRKAVVSIDEENFGEEIYTIAYGDYVNKDLSRYIFEGKGYKNFATDTIPGITLITYFCAAYKAAEINELNKFNSLGIQGGIQAYFDQDMLNTFEIDFKSPGSYTLYAKRAALAVTVALLVSATAGDVSLPEARGAALVNSVGVVRGDAAGVGSPCPVPVEDTYRGIMNGLNVETFNTLCQLNAHAQKGVGLAVRINKSRLHQR